MRNKTQYPTPKTPKNFIRKQLLAALGLSIGTGLLVVFTNLEDWGAVAFRRKATGKQVASWSIPSGASATRSLLKSMGTATLRANGHRALDMVSVGGVGRNLSPLSPHTPLFSHPPISSSPPISKPHPLPPTLARWQDNTNSGDYFSQVTTTEVGYLVWSQFPIKVYVETPKGVSEKQAQTWVSSVLQAVQEWSAYLPLTVVQQPELADITIVRKAPPLQISPGSNIPRARSAQTTYELYTKNKVLFHRFTILLSPSQTGEYIQAAACHELGHALGIWGHSPLQTDALYFSQVRKPSPISARDVNTLKRVYEQPTTLGWPLMNN